MMLYREEYYDEFTDKKWITDILIRKNRNWPIWNIELIFNKNNQKFFGVNNRVSTWIVNSVEDIPF
jgi:replicative DNA helicase